MTQEIRNLHTVYQVLINAEKQILDMPQYYNNTKVTRVRRQIEELRKGIINEIEIKEEMQK